MKATREQLLFIAKANAEWAERHLYRSGWFDGRRCQMFKGDTELTVTDIEQVANEFIAKHKITFDYSSLKLEVTMLVKGKVFRSWKVRDKQDMKNYKLRYVSEYAEELLFV